MSLLAWAAAYSLRFNFEIPAQYKSSMFNAMPLVLVIQGLLSFILGVQRAFWRFTGLIDLRKLLISILLSTALISLILFFIQRAAFVPRSVLLLYALNFAFLTCLARVGYRYIKERRLINFKNEQRNPILILGAGVAGEKLARQLQHSRTWYVAGFLDDDKTKVGGRIHGVKVLGTIENLSQIVKSSEITQAIMALPSVNHEVRRKVARNCKLVGIEVLTVPAIEDLASGKLAVSEVRKLELDDLLGRNPVHLDKAQLQKYISGQTIMITGAGGSIGAELSRQVARFSPKLLIFFEISEYALYLIETEFKDTYSGVSFASVIGDIRSKVRVEEILREYQPTVVFHAAAYKHVPLMENQNIKEAVINNVFGTLNLAKSSAKHGVENFVLISTDKAVNPSSVMGATKRLAEMICESFRQVGSCSNPNFVVTRFGNVIGSTGSVIPRFQSQIASGGPLTVTHPDIKRFFMSISEAAQLVLQAAVLGARGTIFVLDMGKPIRITDVAKELLRLSGKTEEEIGIIYTGLRDGEKMSEELLADGELLTDVGHPKLKIAKSRPSDPNFVEQLEKWETTIDQASAYEVRAELKKFVPEYDQNWE